MATIGTLAKDAGGFVSDATVYEVSDGVKSGRITVRVPADTYDDVVARIKALDIDVESESSSTDDVTEQYIDLEAQVNNLEAEEARYLEILKQATTVDDTLKVSKELDRVRGEIERIQGKLTYLARQVDMSTLSVTITAQADIEVFGIKWRPLFVVKQAFRSMLTGLTRYVDGVIYFLFGLPVLLLKLLTVIVIVFFVLRIAWWFIRKVFGHTAVAKTLGEAWKQHFKG